MMPAIGKMRTRWHITCLCEPTYTNQMRKDKVLHRIDMHIETCPVYTWIMEGRP